MPPLPLRAAAYTRTGILRRFLDLVAEAAPARVDNAWAEDRLELKGGDVRAFLQSVRVLGLVDPYGRLTDEGRRTRSLAERPAVIQAALAAAYPELAEQWARSGGMPRSEVEDFFKVRYGLSASTAAPAAKLFCDLKREYDRPELAAPRPAAASEERAPAPAPPPAPPAGENDVRIAAAEALKAALQVHITAEWDADRINLAFDRMERVLRLVLPDGGEARR